MPTRPTLIKTYGETCLVPMTNYCCESDFYTEVLMVLELSPLLGSIHSFKQWEHKY